MRLDLEKGKIYSKFEIHKLSLFVNAFYLISVKSSVLVHHKIKEPFFKIQLLSMNTIHSFLLLPLTL